MIVPAALFASGKFSLFPGKLFLSTPVSNDEVLFLWVSSLAVSETFPAGRYFHLPYSLYKISGNVFLIYNLEIPLSVPEKISRRLLPGSSAHLPVQENLLLSTVFLLSVDILFSTVCYWHFYTH